MARARKKSPEKKELGKGIEVADDDLQQAFAQLGEALIEDIEEESQKELDVFELYTHALKSKVYLKDQNICPRLIKGYNALLDAVKK